jgi:hypothetical protein
VSAATFHVIYCRGCGNAWAQGDAEPEPGTDFCGCTCTDLADPRYEDWVTDPAPGEIPPGAFALSAAWAAALTGWVPK